jgi:hypothetical protein
MLRLALACGFCNRRKGPNLAGIDPATGRPVPFFHPSADRWTEQFRREEATIIGTTPIWRATVAVLFINSHFQLSIRRALFDEGVFELQ